MPIAITIVIITVMQTMLRTSGQTRKTRGDRQGPRTSTAAWSEILRWESLAWMVIGAAWVVSAWPGLLVAWDGLTAAVVLGLGVLAGFVSWQVVAHGARIGQPANWVGYRWRAARPGRRAKTRRLLAVTVILDAVAWSVTGIGWMVAARVFDWSETLTGALVQVAFGVAFLGWGLLHIRAARRVAASDDDLVVVSRRVLGSGPPTLDDETSRLTAKALRTKHGAGPPGAVMGTEPADAYHRLVDLGRKTSGARHITTSPSRRPSP